MEKNPIEKLMDPHNCEPITLYGEKGEKFVFEQIAFVPLDSGNYAILKPATPLEGMGENEALVMKLSTTGDEWEMELVMEDEIIDAVFAEYNALFEEAN